MEDLLKQKKKGLQWIHKAMLLAFADIMIVGVRI